MYDYGTTPREERTRKKKFNRIAAINLELDTLADVPQNEARRDALYAERQRIGDRYNLLPVQYIWYGLGSPTPGSVLV